MNNDNMTLDRLMDEHPLYYKVLRENYDYVVEIAWEMGEYIYDLIRLTDNLIEHSTDNATEMINYIDNKEIEALWM